MPARTSHSKLDLDARRAVGEQAAKQLPASSHAEWEPSPDRPDPVELLVAQDVVREPDLVPVRHGRMMVSPFTFYRGAAAVMAADLAGQPSSGLDVQLCGDAHLSNFGGYASPERQLLFGLNDFDETLPGPFEYDLKRMAASFTIAGRNNGFTPTDTAAVTAESVKAYRVTMAELAAMRTLQIWYASMSEDDIRAGMSAAQQEAAAASDHKGHRKGHSSRGVGDDTPSPTDVAKSIKKADKTLRKAYSRDSLQALSRLAEVVDGRYRIVHQPPVVVPLRELDGAWGLSTSRLLGVVEDQLQAYQASLSDDRRLLLQKFHIVDVARKVVGVGSVGTRAFIVLLQGRDNQDPLFLQVKEASRSVLEDHLPRSSFANPGQRVVEGQRLMQAASDIFLGWTRGVAEDRFYYWRQLRDMKVSATVETMHPLGMTFYARMCGRALALAHGRTGDPVALAAYLGPGDDLDQALTAFSARYADQNARDHERFVRAAESGSIQAVHGV